MQGITSIDTMWAFTTAVKPSAKAEMAQPLGRPTHFNPAKIPALERAVCLVSLHLYPDTNPYLALEVAVAKHAGTISRLRTRNLRNPDRNNKTPCIST
eukprot:scaffold229402_cov18-Tisochrysis_lutea.AAC.1